jgi:hypothetical protein
VLEHVAAADEGKSRFIKNIKPPVQQPISWRTVVEAHEYLAAPLTKTVASLATME